MSGGVGAAKYSAEERAAMGAAMAGGLSSPEVVARAAAGELLDPATGEPLPAFETNDSMVRHCKGKWARSQQAMAAAVPLVDLAPRDAVETLRRDLLEVVDLERKAIRRMQRDKPADWAIERLRQLARAAVEIARIPGPTEPLLPSKDTRDPATGKRGPAVRGGPVGALLQAHRVGQRVTDEAAEVATTVATDGLPAPPEPPAEPEPEPDPRDVARAEMRENGRAIVLARLQGHDPGPAPVPPQTGQEAAQERRPNGSAARDRDEFPYHRAPSEDLDGMPLGPRRRRP